MNRFLYIAFLSVFLINCTSNTIIKKPDDLISKEQMVDLLTDMFLASGAQHIKNTNLKRNVDYFPLVFEKHQIDSARFKKSNYYYTSKIDDYDQILKEVDSRLRKLRSQFKEERELADSLKKLEKNELKMKKDSIKK